MAARRLLPYYLTNVKSTTEIDRLRSIFRSSPSKLFVGGLTNNVNDEILRGLFTQFGDVVEASIMVDRTSGIRRDFGFVVFSNIGSASAAANAMDGMRVDDRPIRVRFSSSF